MQDRLVDESGWKQVHGDVFRPPRQMVLYAALIGTGHQLFWLGFSVILLIIIGTFYHEYARVCVKCGDLLRIFMMSQMSVFE